MALGAFIAGRYSSTWNSNSLGMTKQGFELEFQFKQETIEESDLYGLTLLDMVLRGCDTYIAMMLKEWNAGSKSVLWPLGGGTLGAIFTTAVPPGVLASSLAAALVLTATANTTAAAAGGPATLTATLAYPAPSFNPKTLLDSRLRELPIRMVFLPSTSSGTTSAFSTT